MKKIFILFSLVFIALSLNAQRLIIKVSEKTGAPELYKKGTVNVYLANDTNEPIVWFQSTYQEYGGNTNFWVIKKDGEQIKERKNHYPLDTDSRFDTRNFRSISPRKKKLVGGIDLEPTEPGKYEIIFSVKQDPSKVDRRYGKNSAAKSRVDDITHLDLTKKIVFEIKGEKVVPFEAKDISYEALQEVKPTKNLLMAKTNPTEVYKVQIKAAASKMPEELEKLRPFKNLRSLEIYLDGNYIGSDLVIPDFIGDLPLMEFMLAGKKPNLTLPDNFMSANNLRKLYFGVKNVDLSFVARQKELKILSLGNTGLTEIPDWIGELTKLENLYIGGNEIRQIPESFNNLKHLKILSFSQSQLTSLDNIFNNAELKTLELGENKLTSLPEEMGKLKKLSKLKLNDNQLRMLPESIGELSAVSEIWVMGNQLTTLPESIGQMPELRLIRADNNNITSLPPSIGNAPKLEKINLDKNQLTSLPDEICKLPNLEIMWLNGNQLSSLPDCIFTDSKLRSLYIENNQFTTLPTSMESSKRIFRIRAKGNPLKKSKELKKLKKAMKGKLQTE